MAEDIKKLTLKGVKVVFFNPEDNGFGTTITIDCTDDAVMQQITDWCVTNKIGKDEPGVPKFKEYTNKDGVKTTQYTFKINEHTVYGGLNGLTKDNIGYGAIVDIVARAFTYNNKFTGGKDKVGQGASAIVVRSASTGGGEADLAELLGEEDEPTETVATVPF